MTAVFDCGWDQVAEKSRLLQNLLDLHESNYPRPHSSPATRLPQHQRPPLAKGSLQSRKKKSVIIITLFYGGGGEF